MIWLNGRLVIREQAHIDPADRGLLLADGLFETLRAYRGHLFKIEDHLQRLAAAAAELAIPLPLDPPAIADAARETLVANQLGAADAALRITLTRGPGQRGLLFPDDPRPNLMISAVAYHAPPALDGLIAITATDVCRNEGSITARLKTLGYLDNILALQQAARAGADEAVLLNNKGRVTCGARSNLFAVVDGQLLTPAIAEGALPGITRHAVFGLSTDLEQPAAEVALAREQLRDAAEVFVTNSLMEIVPIRRLDEKELPVGPVTKRLIEAYSASTPR